MTKIFKKKILISLIVTVFFFIAGLLFISLSNTEKNKNYSIKFSIDLDEKFLFYLDSSDTILITNKIKHGRPEGSLAKIAKNYLNDNSIVKNTQSDFNQISIGEEFILLNSKSKDDIDAKIKKIIKEINKEVNEKVNNLLNLYIEMFQISETIKVKYILSELEDVKKFTFKINKNKKTQSILEILEKNRKNDLNYEIEVLEKFIEKYIESISGSNYVNLYGIIDDYYGEISIQNIPILISRLLDKLENPNNIEINKLKKHKEILSNIEFIKPGKILKILDKSPNVLIILLLFTLTGIFLGITYSFSILQLMNKKRLKSLLYQE